jgi:hypothetical protein
MVDNPKASVYIGKNSLGRLIKVDLKEIGCTNLTGF